MVWRSVRRRLHVHDSMPRSCTSWGLIMSGLTYRYARRDYRLTDVDGRAVQEILA